MKPSFPIASMVCNLTKYFGSTKVFFQRPKLYTYTYIHNIQILYFIIGIFIIINLNNFKRVGLVYFQHTFTLTPLFYNWKYFYWWICSVNTQPLLLYCIACFLHNRKIIYMTSRIVYTKEHLLSQPIFSKIPAVSSPSI